MGSDLDCNSGPACAWEPKAVAVVLINNSLDKIPDTVALASKTIASIENAGDGQGDAEHVVEERTEKILPLATDKTCHGAIEPLPRRPELN